SEALLGALLLLSFGWQLARRRASWLPAARIARVAALALPIALIGVLGLPALPALMQTTPPALTVTITAAGFQPPDVVADPGVAVHWTSATSVPHTVTATNGAFDSGSIPPGGGYSMAMTQPGTFAYRSAGDAAFV